ncbi:MAG: FAD-dependent thymidylate synthase [Oscillospiraceae bacterium]|nr:FAD-dependent thymidylate synthase [Oscillospiraceae bacterium]
MRVIEPSFEIIGAVDSAAIMRELELIGRVCYKSEDRITGDSANRFLASILKRGHESVIEHRAITVKLICDRGVSHELVRHRIASFSQESTRYCNYSGDKFGNELTFVKPFFWADDLEKYALWLEAMRQTEANYLKLLDMGATPEEARAVLPNSLKTEIVMTMNLREWRHFFKLRAAPQAHPQMREIVTPLLAYMKEILPVIFADL